jgi:glutamyl-tRNA(Gln) amidotransferase subunit E
MVLGPEEPADRAMQQIKSRLVDAIHGVPPETRKALDNGNSEFMRKLQGGARLYPDTDSVAIKLDNARVEDIKAHLKGYPWDMKADLVEQYGISEDFAQNLILSGNLDVFLEVMKINPEYAMLATTTLLETVTALSREGKEVENLDTHHFLDVFSLLNEGKMGKEAIEKVLRAACDAPEETISKLLETTVGEAVSVDELDQIIDEVINNGAALIQEKGDQAFSALMGDVMKKVRGKIDGKTVSARLKEKLGGN